MNEEIVTVDKKYRRKLFKAYLIGTAALVTFFIAVVPIIITQLDQMPLRIAFTIIEVTAIMVILLFIGPAYYIIHVGQRIIKHQQIPYPGMKVIRDTIVIRGEKAIRRGRWLVSLGFFAVVMAVVGSFSTYHFFSKFRTDPLLKGALKKVTTVQEVKVR